MKEQETAHSAALRAGSAADAALLWIPAFAGMTMGSRTRLKYYKNRGIL